MSLVLVVLGVVAWCVVSTAAVAAIVLLQRREVGPVHVLRAASRVPLDGIVGRGPGSRV